jgi:small G protein signaling modulator 3
MDTSEPSAPLERSLSLQSATSIKSHRSATPSRHKRHRLTSQPSSSASSIAASDKSLTSFPSFSPESPRDERPLTPDLYDGATLASGPPPPKSPSPTTSLAGATKQTKPPKTDDEDRQKRDRPASIVESLISTPPEVSRDALFEDSPPATRRAIPGALHHADDEHIERLIARHGAVGLVRQIAEDLARRDAQMATLRRRADDRERALRKIILECGLSTLDLETRLRALEQEAKENERSRRASGMGAGDGFLSDMMNDAMADDVRCAFGGGESKDGTIRASSGNGSGTVRTENGRGTAKGWKDYLWGGGTTVKKNNGRPSIGGGDSLRTSQTVIRAPVP